MSINDERLITEISAVIKHTDGRVRVSALNAMLEASGWDIGNDRDLALLCKGLDFQVRVVENTLYVSL